MSVLEAIFLGLVQGLTEFIPVSSSGHLVLLHELFGITENGLTFDVALHFGTLVALLIFFHKDIVMLIKGMIGKNEHGRLAWILVAATVPAVVVGVLLENAAASAFRSSSLVALNLIFFGFIMLAAEIFAKRYARKTKLEKVSLKQGLAIGVAQALAIVPGVSRSGGTITAGLFVGMNRVAATRFSFLLGIPIMMGATAKVMLLDNGLASAGSEIDLFVIGIVTALLSGLFAIKFLLNFLAKHTLATFAYYRIGLGAFVLLIGIMS